MKVKLFLIFCGKEKIMTGLFIFLVIVSTMFTAYNLTLLCGTYKMWKPVMELGENWYYYPNEQREEDEIQKYLRREQGGMSLDEFRYMKFNSQERFFDLYSNGMIFEASSEELREVRKVYKEAEKIFPVSNLIIWECRFFSIIKVSHFVAMLVFWVIAIVFGVVWFRQCLWKSKEEIQCLIYMGYDKDKIKRLYCSVTGWGLPAVWLSILLIKFIPTELIIWFWKIYFSVLLETALILVLFFLIMYVCFRCIWQREGWQEVLKEKATKRFFINDLSLTDNLKLILIIQGFSERSAMELVMSMIEEKEILFCARRPMSQVVENERIHFFEIQDELLRSS